MVARLARGRAGRSSSARPSLRHGRDRRTRASGARPPPCRRPRSPCPRPAACDRAPAPAAAGCGTRAAARSRWLWAYAANWGSRTAWRKRRLKPSGSSRATTSSERAPMPRRSARDMRGQELLGEPVGDPLEHRPVELFLGVEVAVDDELGDARRGGDVLHRRGREPGAGEGRRPPRGGWLLALGPGQQTARGRRLMVAQCIRSGLHLRV